MIEDMHPTEGENEAQFLWRIGSAKDAGILDASWDEIGKAMNSFYRADKDEYRTASAYRKPYQYAKMFIGSVLTLKKGNESWEDSTNIKADILKEKQKLRDERAKYLRALREDARLEEKLDELTELIKEQGKENYHWGNGEKQEQVREHKREMLILLSDWHIGMNIDSEFGHFNIEVAKKRIKALAGKAFEMGERYQCDTCSIVALGDMISGSIHKTTQLGNQENVMEQVQKASTLLANFVAEACGFFSKVRFTSVAGNHSRLEACKEDALKDERLDDLIAWYVESSLKGVKNLKVVKPVDNTVAEMDICGNLFYFTHGDHEKMTQNDIGKLSFMLGDIPYAVCFGHKHKFEMADIGGVKVVRNGSLCGSGSDYMIERRLSGKPCQTLLVCDERGIECVSPVELC